MTNGRTIMSRFACNSMCKQNTSTFMTRCRRLFTNTETPLIKPIFNMPVRLIGKPSPYTGYLLFEILNKLKYFGVGRVVIRNSFKKFPGISFYVIRKVIPMRETIGPGPEELVFGKVWVDEVYRGRKLEGLKLIKEDTYLPDYFLIPRYEEDKYLNYKSQEVVKIIPKYIDVPPVLSELMKQKNPGLKEKPQVEAVYKKLPEHFVCKIAEDGMKPDYLTKVELPDKFKAGIKY